MSQSFERSMLQELPRLRRYAESLTRSACEAEDLVQDALVRAWRFRASFRPGTNLRAWLTRIVKNEFLSQRQRGRREEAGLWISESFACDPDQEWRIRVGEVLAALPQLPTGNRRALLLVAAEGLSYDEAARRCGCDANVLRSRVRRARVKLAELTDGAAEHTRAP